MENTQENKAKQCSRCHTLKEESCFYSRLGKLTAACKECLKKGSSIYQNNQDYNSEYKKKKRESQKERYHSEKKIIYPDDLDSFGVEVIGYEGLYRVKDDGQITRFYVYKGTFNVLTHCADRLGYIKVKLCKNSISKSISLHKIVAIAFLPNPFGHQEINHINGIKSDNRADNLEWCTRSHNIKEAFRLGLKKGITKRHKNGTIAKKS